MAQSIINGERVYSTTWTENGITFTATRIGRIVTLQANNGGTTKDMAANEAISYVPVGYRPANFFLVWNASQITQVSVIVRQSDGGIAAGGNVVLQANSYLRFLATYITKDAEPS